MDVNLPGMSGIECVQQLTARENPPQVIMLTVRQDSEIIFASLAAGACGYLLKPPTASQLVDAVRDVFSGGAPMTASIARRVAQSFKKQETKNQELQTLSPREVEVLELLAKGYRLQGGGGGSGNQLLDGATPHREYLSETPRPLPHPRGDQVSRGVIPAAGHITAPVSRRPGA